MTVRWDPTRQDAAYERAAWKPCTHCQHPAYRHRELQGTWEWQGEGLDRELVEVKPPDYEMAVFHCSDCGCVVRR